MSYAAEVLEYTLTMATTSKKQSRKQAKPATRKSTDRFRGHSGTIASCTPIERIYHIHSAVASGRLPNCGDLAEELNVTSKTIQRDINYMRETMNLPMHYEDTKHGFYYKKDVGDLPIANLTTEELATLFLARTALLPLRGTRLADKLGQAFQRITRPLQDRVSFSWAELDGAFSVKNPGASEADLATFGTIAEAIMVRKEIQFAYRKQSADKPEPRKVQPLHLGEVAGGWYLIAHDLERAAIRTFALPRISKLKITAAKFKRPDDFDARAFLNHSFGIWNDGGAKTAPIEVKVQFDGYAARVVPERLWHSSQAIKELNAKGTRIEVTMSLANLQEVTRWILSWGSCAKVIAPAALANAVRDEAKLIVQNSK